MPKAKSLGDFLTAVEMELPANKSKCDVSKILALMPESDRSTVTTALANPAYTGVAIARALTKSGHPIGESSVQRHRRRVCKCDREQ